MAEFAWTLAIATVFLYVAVFAFSEGNAFAELQGEFAETDAWDLGDLPDVIVAFFVDLFDLFTFGGIEGLHVLFRVGVTFVLAVLWVYAWLK